MFDEPLRDAWHVLLECAWNRQIEHSGTGISSVFEIVGDASGYKDERPLRCVSPFIGD